MQVQLKTTDKYCFEFNADHDTVFNLDFLLTGDKPDNVDFTAVQAGVEIMKLQKKRDSTITIDSRQTAPIQFCWQKFDRKAKKLDFSVTRNVAHSQDAADLGTLDSLEQDIGLLMEELE